MDLIDILKGIGKAYDIPESKLILEEAEFFREKHKGHGCYKIELFHDETGLLRGIDLICVNTDSIEGTNCRWDEFPTSIIYEEDESMEGDLKAQKEKREREKYENN